ncbi:MAG: single-stranded-DNA-specific exonuclease RecJ [Candidatus Pacebacteria bacterium]|nr:single-stranded-DNA-specific exonuclease RecJ [Candidatus Paceibacterota bacterium]
MFLTDLQKKILESKGFDLEKKEEIEKFLSPDWDKDLLDSGKIKGIKESIERIKEAIEKKEKIIIYADYDCDGIPGAVILNDFFEKLNYRNFSVYIPHRHNEGYGLNTNAIQKFIDEGVSLLITVDIGITNLEEIKFAEENGINVIVTDHHLPILDDKAKQILPKAFSIINTKQIGDKSEEKFLCGASTAWKLVNAFLNKYRKEFDIGEGWEKWLLDMVGIATVADLVPLKNENRLLAKYGLAVLKKTRRPGLLKIFSNAKINQRKINEDDIAFGIAPRINAASRMSEPIHAFYALLQNEKSINFANELENYNKARKQETKDAETVIDYEKFQEEKIILIGDEKWTPGIIGLVASKVCETVKKTTFVWGVGEDKNILKGSVRAGEDGYNVVEIMTECQYLLENFGGHEMAGGFAIHKNNLNKFQTFLKEYKVEKKEDSLEGNQKIKKIPEHIDMNISDINKKLFDEIKIFAPFGSENEKIIFKIKLSKDNFLEARRFGKNKEHLEISLNGLRGIEFFANEEREKELLSQKVFFINLEWDNFKGDIVMRFVK